ncbi:MAG: inositol monophosphatase family protein [Actinobacteria bacterium]|nr:MAG: inositol monophosphatase family protein [Actinomycetota bacterium]
MGRDPEATLAELLSVGRRAVGVAAEMIRSRGPAAVTAKGDRDQVTDVDLAVERTIRDLLAEATPGIGFLGEEEGRSGDTARTPQTWALDPIDGTVNYAAGSPLCAVSLALLEEGQPVLGVIDLPFLGQQYWATAGGGAFLNGEPVRAPAGPRVLGEAIVALGDFATGPDATGQNDLQLRLAGLLAGRALRIRMLGSAAIDLAWLAAGRHHASVTLCNRPWDMAAGVVIAREAGATVADLDGSGYSLASRSVIVATGRLGEELLATVEEAQASP